MKQKILVQSGIITEADARPTPTVADCARCRLVNPLENKYCSSCGYPLSVEAYEELKAADSGELNRIKEELGQRGQEIVNLTTQLKDVQSQTKGIADFIGWIKTYYDPLLGRRMQISSADQTPRETATQV